MISLSLSVIESVIFALNVFVQAGVEELLARPAVQPI
jgi:hypothetical protein